MMMTAVMTQTGQGLRQGYNLGQMEEPSRSVMYMMDGDLGILLSSDRLMDGSRIGMDRMRNSHGLGLSSGMLVNDNMRLRQDRLTSYGSNNLDMIDLGINGRISQDAMQRTMIPQMRNSFRVLL